MPDRVNAVVLDLERYEELLELERWINTLTECGLCTWEGIQHARNVYFGTEKEIYE